MAIITDIETRLRERLSRPGRVQISAKTWSTAEAAIGAPKVFESAESLSFAAAWSPIISRTTLIPASLFVMIESSCKAQVTSPTPILPERLEATCRFAEMRTKNVSEKAAKSEDVKIAVYN